MSNRNNAVVPFKKYLDKAMPKIAGSLPKNVSPERFQGIAAMAINNNNKLADCARDNPSLVLNSLLMCAADGLLPDNREATMTAYKTKNGWQLTYNPMIAGLLKRLYQTGKVKDVLVELVYRHDVDNGNFKISLGENATIFHEPDPFCEDRGEMVGVYAVVKMLNGGVFREFMTHKQVMAVKGAASGAQYGPWSGPFAGEMWRKSVLRRCIKKCPVSSDVIELFQRDDGMYKFGGDLTETSAVDTLKANMADKVAGKSTPLIDAEPKDITPRDDRRDPSPESQSERDDQNSSDKAADDGAKSDNNPKLNLPTTPSSMTDDQWGEFTTALIADHKACVLSDADFDALYSLELGAIAEFSSENYNRILDVMSSDD